MVNQGRPDSEYWRHHSRDAWGEFMMCATGDEKVYEISVSIEPRTARFSIRSNLSGSRTEVLRSEVEELSAKCKEAPEQLANAEGATQSSNGRRDCSNAANRATGGTGTHEDSQTSVGRSGGENEAARPRAEGSNDSGGIARVEEPETKAVEATAMALNTKAHAAFGSQSSERIAKIDRLSKAIAVLEKGMTGESFLHGGVGTALRRAVTNSEKVCDSEHTSVLSFLSEGGRYAPQSDETAGILKQLKDETRADLSALEKEELNRKSNH